MGHDNAARRVHLISRTLELLVTDSLSVTAFFFFLYSNHFRRKEAQTAVVWTCLPFIGSGQNHLASHSERGKKTRQTEEEVGRQHQGMDRPGVRQVPEGSGEQGKMEQT